MLAANITSSVIQPLFGHFSDKKEKALFLPIGCLCAGSGSPCSPCRLITRRGAARHRERLGVASYHPEGYKTAHFFTGDKPATACPSSRGRNLGFALARLSPCPHRPARI